jgi:iron complex outermembrane receptor protein
LFEPAEQWRLGVSLSSATRAPAQTELYARGVHEATATWEIGDADLARERATTAELSLRWRAGRVHADAAVWVSDFSNFIYGELTGRTCSEDGDCVDGDGEELIELLYTQQGARFHGAEGHAEIELFQGAMGDLHLNLMADVVRARLDGGAGNVPRIPPYRIGGGVSWHGAQFDAGVFLRYSGEQDRTAANETTTASFSNLDAQVAWRPWAGRPGLELALAGRNLTDSRQRNAVALNKDEVMLAGREIRLILRARFD